MWLRWPSGFRVPRLEAGNPARDPRWQPRIRGPWRDLEAARIDDLRLRLAEQSPTFRQALEDEDDVTLEDLRDGASGEVRVDQPAARSYDFLDGLEPHDAELAVIEELGPDSDAVARDILKAHKVNSYNPWKDRRFHPEVTEPRRSRLAAAYDRVSRVSEAAEAVRTRGGPRAESALMDALDQYADVTPTRLAHRLAGGNRPVTGAAPPRGAAPLPPAERVAHVPPEPQPQPKPAQEARLTATTEVNPTTGKPISTAEVVARILAEWKRPASSSELMAELKRRGVMVGGKDPSATFGACMSFGVKRGTVVRLGRGQYSAGVASATPAPAAKAPAPSPTPLKATGKDVRDLRDPAPPPSAPAPAKKPAKPRPKVVAKVAAKKPAPAKPRLRYSLHAPKRKPKPARPERKASSPIARAHLGAAVAVGASLDALAQDLRASLNAFQTEVQEFSEGKLTFVGLKPLAMAVVARSNNLALVMAGMEQHRLA